MVAWILRMDGGLGLDLGPHRRHGLAGAVDLPGQLIGPLDRVAEDLDERLDHGLERRHVVVPDDHGPQVFVREEVVDVRVRNLGHVDGGGVGVRGHDRLMHELVHESQGQIGPEHSTPAR
jgi:hypothetical protein